MKLDDLPIWALETTKNTYDDKQLKSLLEQHKEWIYTDEKDGKLADLSKSTLVKVNLQEETLCQAIIQEADLHGADLQEATLRETNLQKTNLNGANLQGADLAGANLQEATLRDANLQGAILYGANLQGADLQKANCRNTIFINAMVENIKIQGADLTGAKFLNDELQELFLNHNIQEAQNALANSLKNANEQIKEHRETALETQKQAKRLLWLILAILFILFFLIFGLILCGNNNFNELLDKLGAWSLILFNFPIIVILTIAVTLLRHQKKLLDEVRHYSAERRQIELYSGLLEASQYVATSLNDPQKSAEYVHETFTAIRDRILSEQPHTNTAGSAVEQEEYSSSLEPLIKVISEMIAKGETKK